MVPALPLLLFSLRHSIPHDRRVLWGAAVLSALMASADLVHFRNVFPASVSREASKEGRQGEKVEME